MSHGEVVTHLIDSHRRRYRWPRYHRTPAHLSLNTCCRIPPGHRATSEEDKRWQLDNRLQVDTSSRTCSWSRWGEYIRRPSTRRPLKVLELNVRLTGRSVRSGLTCLNAIVINRA